MGNHSSYRANHVRKLIKPIEQLYKNLLNFRQLVTNCNQLKMYRKVQFIYAFHVK